MAYYMASVSWGKDSLAMLLRLINENKPRWDVWGNEVNKYGN